MIQTEGSSTKTWNLNIIAKFISKNKENKEITSNEMNEKLELLVLKATNNLISNLKSDLNGLLIPTIELELQPQLEVEVEVEAVGMIEKSDSEELFKKLKRKNEGSSESSIENEVTPIINSTPFITSSSSASPPISSSSSSSTSSSSTTSFSTTSSSSSSSSSSSTTSSTSSSSNMNLGGISDPSEMDIKAAYKALGRAADIINPKKKSTTADEGSAKRNTKGFRNDGKFIDISETSQVHNISTST